MEKKKKFKAKGRAGPLSHGKAVRVDGREKKSKGQPRVCAQKLRDGTEVGTHKPMKSR